MTEAYPGATSVMGVWTLGLGFLGDSEFCKQAWKLQSLGAAFAKSLQKLRCFSTFHWKYFSRHHQFFLHLCLWLILLSILCLRFGKHSLSLSINFLWFFSNAQLFFFSLSGSILEKKLEKPCKIRNDWVQNTWLYWLEKRKCDCCKKYWHKCVTHIFQIKLYIWLWDLWFGSL